MSCRPARHFHIEEAFALLAPYLVVLNEADRASTPRPRDGFDPAARSLYGVAKAASEVNPAPPSGP